MMKFFSAAVIATSLIAGSAFAQGNVSGTAPAPGATATVTTPAKVDVKANVKANAKTKLHAKAIKGVHKSHVVMHTSKHKLSKHAVRHVKHVKHIAHVKPIKHVKQVKRIKTAPALNTAG